MRNILILFHLLAACWAVPVAAQDVRLSHTQASAYFEEVRQATAAHSSLWGKDLYGPLLLVDPATRRLYANVRDSSASLEAEGGIFVGSLPAHVNMANTSVRWNGTTWAMVMLPLPALKADRVNLLAHELFHSAQPALGFTLANADNGHLDSKQGRIYLRLELEALRAAVTAPSATASHRHLSDAMAFRKVRHGLFPGSASAENALELNEGIAEFTGFVTSGQNTEEARAHFGKQIDRFLSNPSFVRSFAYQTVPIYGYLLRETDAGWNRRIRSDTDLTQFFVDGLGLSPVTDLDSLAARSESYGKTAIETEETERDEANQRRVRQYRQVLVEQPHFVLVFEKMNVSFDPRTVVSLGEAGSVYPSIRIADLWGVLTVEKGALMSPNWDKIAVSLPLSVAETEVRGDGWVLELAQGYAVRKLEDGHYRLVKKPQ